MALESTTTLSFQEGNNLVKEETTYCNQRTHIEFKASN